MAPDPIQLVEHGNRPGEIRIYTWHNIMIVGWTRAADGASVKRLMQARKEQNARHPEGVSLVHMIGPGTSLPTAEARAGLTELMRRYSDDVACIAVVILSGGFFASAVRSAVTGMRMLVSAKSKLRFHTAIDEVCAWLPGLHEDRTGVQISADQLLGVLEQIESAFQSDPGQQLRRGAGA